MTDNRKTHTVIYLIKNNIHFTCTYLITLHYIHHKLINFSVLFFLTMYVPYAKEITRNSPFGV